MNLSPVQGHFLRNPSKAAFEKYAFLFYRPRVGKASHLVFFTYFFKAEFQNDPQIIVIISTHTIHHQKGGLGTFRLEICTVALVIALNLFFQERMSPGVGRLFMTPFRK